ncbi:MAG: ribose-phosphate diphosphokinase [Candidatus Berkiella sp.]
MNRTLFNLYGCSQFNESIIQSFGFVEGDCQIHYFPDGESIVRLNTAIDGHEILLIANLVDPNPKLFPLIITAETARQLGAKKVHLFVPYLPYMRQDMQFHANEGITSRYFAKIISQYFDSLLTIEPHLHRWHDLTDIYSIPATALHPYLPICAWLKDHIAKPLLIGPDRESEQWISRIAKLMDAPFVVFDKVRHGDKHVEISSPSLASFAGFHPVIIDDVISTGHTMLKILRYLHNNDFKENSCIGVHALFADDAYEQLKAAGATNIITCNSITHPSNQIDLSISIEDYLKINLLNPNIQPLKS